MVKPADTLVSYSMAATTIFFIIVSFSPVKSKAAALGGGERRGMERTRLGSSLLFFLGNVMGMGMRIAKGRANIYICMVMSAYK